MSLPSAAVSFPPAVPAAALPQAATLVVTERVRPEQVPAFESWARQLHAVMRQQPGFVSVHVVRDPARSVPEYITVLRFESQAALESWRQSAAYRAALEDLPRFTASGVNYQESSGLDTWFDRPADQPAPPVWKNILVGFLGVYPLILLFTWLCGPLTKGLPWWAAIFPSAFLATAFLNWPVLPLLSRWLRGWLYPAQGR